MTEAIGHNQGPALDPIQSVLDEYADTICEAQNWADGEPVTDEAAMIAIDAVIKEFRSYKTALGKAGTERTSPLHKAWKAEVAAVKIYTDDAELMQKALVDLVAPFKSELAAQKEAQRRAAWDEAERLRNEAEQIERDAQAGNIDQVREAEEAKKSALDAKKVAQSASADNVKGMRKVQHHEIVSMRDLVNWIATNDKKSMAVFATEFAAKHHDAIPNDIVRSWNSREAY